MKLVVIDKNKLEKSLAQLTNAGEPIPLYLRMMFLELINKQGVKIPARLPINSWVDVGFNNLIDFLVVESEKK